MISNDLDINLDLETHNKSHYLISQVDFSWKSYSVYIHMIIIKLLQVLIENVPQLDIDAQLDLNHKSEIRNEFLDSITYRKVVSYMISGLVVDNLNLVIISRFVYVN